MGADDRTVQKTVILPLILPYLVSGYAFAFVLSLNEYIVAYMTIGFTPETLPIKIFNALVTATRRPWRRSRFSS